MSILDSLFGKKAGKKPEEGRKEKQPAQPLPT
jgi:hypothetical protein